MRPAVLCAVACAASLAAQGYQLPPQPLVDCIDQNPPPSVSVSPDRTTLLLSTREAMPTIDIMARPLLRLAGHRIDPQSRGRQRGARTRQLELMRIDDGRRWAVRGPDDADLGSVRFSADGSRIAFTNTTSDAIELWVAEVAGGAAAKIDGIRLNGTIGTTLQWMPDQRHLLCLTVARTTPPPAPPNAPSGPNVQETRGGAAPVRTYQDLLQTPHDADLFEHFAESQLVSVDTETNAVRAIGAPALYTSVAPSPDGELLLVTALQRPFSYLVTSRSFPQTTSVIDLQGDEVRQICVRPLADRVPIGGVIEGPRRVAWIPSEPRTLHWVEARDGGDPKREVPHRDELMTWTAGEAAPTAWLRIEHRFRGLDFAADGDWALLSEYDRDARRARSWRVHPRMTDATPELLLDRSTQDSYGDPGRPLRRLDPRGRSVLHTIDGDLLLAGSGASPTGDRPFLDRGPLGDTVAQRLFECAEGRYEQVVAVLDAEATRILLRAESTTEPANYFVVETGTGERRQLTHFEDPMATMTAGIEKQLLHYERGDGVPLSGTLYTPPGYDKTQRLPLLVWAYPREFTRAADAGQVRGSPHRYTRLAGTSPLLLTLAGYAVLDSASMPIIGPTETANDTFVPQLVANAQAAIDAVVELGVADRDRCAIAGHSYGAFMTANLLAHSDLFRAGVARSGAYNRTLTPFGFQNEERTFWQAPEIYFGMSPFMHANKVDEPLLLIHGEIDNNSGTFPIQSRRFYHAIKGHGGTARLVMLPHESHGYRARESVLHCVAETVAWLDEHVKNAAARPAAAEAGLQRAPSGDGSR